MLSTTRYMAMRPMRRAVPTPFSTGFKGIAEVGVPVLFLVGITIFGIRSADPTDGGTSRSDLSEVAMTQPLDGSSDSTVTGDTVSRGNSSGGFSDGDPGSTVRGQADSSSTFRTAEPSGNGQTSTGSATNEGAELESNGTVDVGPGLTEDDRGLIDQTDQRDRNPERTAEEQQRLLDEYWQAVVREAESGIIDLSLFDTPILLVPDPEVGLRPVFTDPDSELAAPSPAPEPVALPSPEPDPIPEPDETDPADDSSPDTEDEPTPDTGTGTDTDSADTDSADTDSTDNGADADGTDADEPTASPETDAGNDPDQQDPEVQPSDDPIHPADPDLVCPTPEPTPEDGPIGTDDDSAAPVEVEDPTSMAEEADEDAITEPQLVVATSPQDPREPTVPEPGTGGAAEEPVVQRQATDDHDSAEDCLTNPDGDGLDPLAGDSSTEQLPSQKPPNDDSPASDSSASAPAGDSPLGNSPAPLSGTPEGESGTDEPTAIADPAVGGSEDDPV